MWSRDSLEQFIGIYRSFPCLWKVKSEEYKNKHLKNRAYDELVKLCKRDICPSANKDFGKKKIQGIRGAFRKELNKVNETTRSGCSEEDVYKPCLWYFDLLLFTRDQEEPADSTSNIESIETVVEGDNVEIYEIHEEVLSVEKETEKETEKEKENIPESSGQASIKTSCATSKSRKRTSAINANAEFMQVCKRALETSNIDPTEYEIVGMNVAKKLTKMKSSQAITAEALINSILTKGLLNELTANTVISEKQEFYNMSYCNTPSTSSTPTTTLFLSKSVQQNFNIPDESNSSYLPL